MKRSALKRTAGFKSRKSRGAAKLQRDGNYKNQYSSLNKVGKGGRRNGRALRVFKKECTRLGVEPRCERRGKHCTGTENLTWAHGRKRRELKDGELESFAIVCCVNCHREMDEQMTHGEMATEVERIIGLRPERYLEAA